jgi:hypothetical protein
MINNVGQPYDIQKTQFPCVAASIASGQALSNVIYTNGLTLCGILIPVQFTGTALTFETCQTDSGTFVPLYNASGQVSYSISTAQYVAINPQDFYGVGFLIIKSQASEAALRNFFVALRGF